jgi:uncharacterized caspase-like protein
MRQWAISVGINQYQFFQPLSYAQNDAQAMQQFLVDDVGIPAEQCLLLTETSPPQWGKSTYPDRQTIQSWLDLLTQRYIQPEDTLWFFFSGYGVCQQGQDYLVPIEGDPAAVQTTTIPLESIFRSLRQVAAAKVLVLLDVNRNESSFSYETVGTHTVHLASITGIPTLLSCQPDEFSRETSALRHGFFTAALLESLRNRQSATVGALGQYLSQQLPALSEHYWRPMQRPVTICPTEKLQQPLVLSGAHTATYAAGDRVTPPPSAANEAEPLITLQALAATANLNHSSSTSTNSNGNRHLAATAVVNPAQGGMYTPNGGGMGTHGGSIVAPGEHPGTQAVSLTYSGSNGFISGSAQSASSVINGHGFASAHTQPNSNGTHSPIDSATQNHQNGVAQSTQAVTVPQSNFDLPEDANEISDALFWRTALRWGSFVVVGLILGVLLRNCAAFTPKTPSAAQQDAQSGLKKASSGQAPLSAASPNGTPLDAKSPEAKSPEAKSIVPISAPAAPVGKALLPQSIAATQRFGVSGASRLHLSATTGAVGTQPAQPKTTRTAQPPAQSHLAKARALAAVNSGQASPYWYAIQEARFVQPGQPDYVQAKQEIVQWSRQIMSIARQRGRQGGFDAAIVAAHLVSSEQTQSAEAKRSIASWCPSLRRQRGANPVQRNQARAICRS